MIVALIVSITLQSLETVVAAAASVVANGRLMRVEELDASLTACAEESRAEQCQQTGGCMWHRGACRNQPEHNKRCFVGSAFTDCIDVSQCASGASAPEPTPQNRWAFVLTHSSPQDLDVGDYEVNLEALRTAAEAFTNTDVILLIPKEGAAIDAMGGRSLTLRSEAASRLREMGVLVQAVDWALPPGMIYSPKVPWCGSKDLMRLHVMGLTGYAAVIYMDFDVQLMNRHAASQLFRCASTGRILWTPDVMGPINIGVFAVKPSSAIRETGKRLAQSMNFSKVTGWGNAGFASGSGCYIGAECGQGFFLTMFFMQDFDPVAAATAAAKVTLPPASQMDHCRWNYLHGWDCPKSMSCDDVVFLHKASFDPGGCRQRQRFGFYLHVERETGNVPNLLRAIRKMSWQSPIYIASDGGLNFSKACANTKPCDFSWHPHANDRQNPRPFLDRFRRAAESLQAEYVVYLEPNAVLSGARPTHLPGADAGFVQDASEPQLARPLLFHLEELGRVSAGLTEFRIPSKRAGFRSGSIVRTEAALRAFRPESLDWRKLEALGGAHVFSSEVAVAAALVAHGFRYERWAALEPDSKAFVFTEASKEDAAFAPEQPSVTVKEVDCRGCIWQSDAACTRDASGPLTCPASPPPEHERTT